MNQRDHKKILREKKLKATKSRLAVLQVLESQRQPLDIEAIKTHLTDTRPNNVTLYRMMEDLSRVGIVRQIDLRQGRAFFEMMPLEDHHHIVCASCNKIEDIHGCILVDEIERTIKKSKNFDSSIDHVFEIFALCKACKN